MSRSRLCKGRSMRILAGTRERVAQTGRWLWRLIADRCVRRLVPVSDPGFGAGCQAAGGIGVVAVGVVLLPWRARQSLSKLWVVQMSFYSLSTVHWPRRLKRRAL